MQHLLFSKKQKNLWKRDEEKDFPPCRVVMIVWKHQRSPMERKQSLSCLPQAWQWLTTKHMSWAVCAFSLAQHLHFLLSFSWNTPTPCCLASSMSEHTLKHCSHFRIFQNFPSLDSKFWGVNGGWPSECKISNTTLVSNLKILCCFRLWC